MEPRRPSQSNLHDKSMRAKGRIRRTIDERASATKRSRRTECAVETRCVGDRCGANAKEQAKQDMRIRREREKGEAARGTRHQDDVTGESRPGNNNNNNNDTATTITCRSQAVSHCKLSTCPVLMFWTMRRWTHQAVRK